MFLNVGWARGTTVLKKVASRMVGHDAVSASTTSQRQGRASMYPAANRKGSYDSAYC